MTNFSVFEINICFVKRRKEERKKKKHKCSRSLFILKNILKALKTIPIFAGIPLAKIIRREDNTDHHI